MQWILRARLKANSESNIQSAWSATGLIPFNPNRVLSLLKEKKEYTSRPTTPEEQSNQPPPATPHVRIQQGTLPIDLPIGKTDEPKQWIDKLSTDTPSIAVYKAKLEAFIDWQVADGRVKQQEIQSLQKAADNRKSRSKKTIDLKIINAETYTTYYE